jgi:HlyD family secretion protein
MNLIRKIFKRKILLAVVIVILAGSGYYGYQKLNLKETTTRYTLGKTTKETLITSVSGSGQVSVSNQVDIKSQVSGDVLSVKVKNGQEVKLGDILAQLDAQEAQKSVRDAQANLASAKLTLEKLKKPTDSYSLLQAENSLTSARDSLEKLKLSQQTEYQKAGETKTKAEDDMVKSYEDAFNAIANAFLDLPNIMTKLNDILYSYEISISERGTGGSDNNSMLINAVSSSDRDDLQIFQKSALNDYQTADSKYDASFEHYKNTSRYSDRADIESLLTEMLETTKAVAQAGKSESNYLDSWVDYRSQQQETIFSKVTEYQTSLAAYIGKINTHLSNLLSIQRTLQDDREAITSAESDLKAMEQNNPLDLAAAEASVKEKELSLADLKAGTDAYDLQSQELAVRQKQNALLDAQEKLADYTIRAPFDGVIASVDIKIGDSASASGAIATLITKQQIAEISLNEVDAANVKTGQKATMTFDAVSDLTMTGEVADIDTIGTVSQGVVSYTVKINFDTQNEQVKPGMSVSASIITDTKLDVLAVPNSAVKTQGETNYVEMFDNTITQNLTAAADSSASLEITSTTAPSKRTVVIGITNDTSTEIVSGLNEGDLVVTRTIASAVSSSSSSSSSSKSSKSSSQGAGFIMGGGPPN